jgi:ComF family protein
MANAIAEHIKNPVRKIHVPDAILPVPLHRRRLRNRGFNQALEIAKPIAKKLNIPLITNTLIRSRYTQAQTKLNARNRRSNLRNSFRYQPTIPYKNIAVVDDVMTTGTTLHEITKTLKQHACVANVYIWVCACTEDGVNSGTYQQRS